MEAKDIEFVGTWDAYEKGRKAGIKEVVDWMESKESVARADKDYRFAIYRDDWEVKLKDWDR